MTRLTTHGAGVLLLAVLLSACASVPDERYVPLDPIAAPLSSEITGAARQQSENPNAGADADAVQTPAVTGREQLVIFGTDEFTNPDIAPARSASAGGDGDITLNFVDADIREVVRSILGDILALNYTIDPQVAGNVTIQTSRPVSQAALLPTLEALLRSSGAAMLRDGDLYRIIASENLAENTRSVSRRSGAPGFGVQVVPLRFVAASEMAGILELFAPQGSILKADGDRNLLILQGTKQTRATLLETVSLFDVDWIKGMSFGLFPLENSNAETVVGELETIFSEAGLGPSRELLRFIPVARLNAVIAISPRSFYLEQAQAFIKRLDKGIDGVGERLHVYYVQNVRAPDLAESLSGIFSKPNQNGQGNIALPQVVPAAFATAGAEPASPEVRETAALAPSPASQSIDLTGAGQIRIIAAAGNNALLVLATPQNYRMVEKAIRQLDVVPLQVLIEATIAEVTLNDALRYGVQFFLESGNSQFNLSEFTTGVAGQVFPGFSYLLNAGSSARVVLNALSSVTDINVISSPQLMVLDNHTAELQVGDEVPIATQSSVSVDNPNAPIVNTIEFRDTGVILRVTPRVNAGGLVIMDIEQEVSAVVNTTTSGIDSPTIQQRRITSSVAIQSGQTVTLGGLISEKRERSSSGVPGLSTIPVVGALFGRKTDNETRTELLILITPRVVANQLDARKVTEELRSRMRAIRPLGKKVK